VSRLSRQCGILNISQPYRPPRPVKGIALLFSFLISQKTWTFKPRNSTSWAAWVFSPRSRYFPFSRSHLNWSMSRENRTQFWVEKTIEYRFLKPLSISKSCISIWKPEGYERLWFYSAVTFLNSLSWDEYFLKTHTQEPNTRQHCWSSFWPSTDVIKLFFSQ
jgi:hypothetical protein